MPGSSKPQDAASTREPEREHRDIRAKATITSALKGAGLDARLQIVHRERRRAMTGNIVVYYIVEYTIGLTSIQRQGGAVLTTRRRS